MRNARIGNIYEVVVEFLNITNVGRRLKVIPAPSAVVSVRGLKYEGN